MSSTTSTHSAFPTLNLVEHVTTFRSTQLIAAAHFARCWGNLKIIIILITARHRKFPQNQLLNQHSEHVSLFRNFIIKCAFIFRLFIQSRNILFKFWLAHAFCAHKLQVPSIHPHETHINKKKPTRNYFIQSSINFYWINFVFKAKIKSNLDFRLVLLFNGFFGCALF